MAEYPKLGSLQSKVLCYVAEENPPSIMAIAREVAGRNMYKNVRDIIIRFEDDGYIEKHRKLGYYPTYIGVNLSLLNEADPKKVKKQVDKFFTDMQLAMLYLACDVGAHPNLGPEILRLFSVAGDEISKGKIPLIGIPIEDGKLDDFLALLHNQTELFKTVDDLLKKAMEPYFK